MLVRCGLLFLLFAFFAASSLSAQVACYAQVNASVSPGNCLADITAEDLLAGDYGGATTSVSPAGPYEVGSYTLTVSVGAPYNNSCWTRLKVEDKTSPTISCSNTTRTVADPETLDYGAIVNSLTTYEGGCVSAFSYDLNDYGSYVIYNATVVNWSSLETASCSGVITIVDGEPQVYCNTGGNTNYEHISRVAVNGLGCSIDRTSGADSGGYHYEPAFTPATLVRNRTYTIALEAGYTSSAYAENWRVYLDINRDGDFTDAGETLVAWSGYNGTSLNFTVPANIDVGYTRLRVAMRYGSSPSSCGNMPWGEVEDYSVFLSYFYWFPWFNSTAEPQDQISAARYHPRASEADIQRRAQEIARGAESVGATNSIATSLVKTAVIAYPNPLTKGQALVVAGRLPAGKLLAYDLSGRIILEQNIQPDSDQQTLRFTQEIPFEMVLLRAIDAKGQTIWSSKILVAE